MVKEATRDIWGWNRLAAIGKDLRYAVRALARSPVYTIVVLLTIVLTIGGFSTIFTLVDSVLLEPLPYPAAERLVEIRQVDVQSPRSRTSAADLAAIQGGDSFELVGGYYDEIHTLEFGDAPHQVILWTATPEIVPLLGMTAGRGRMLGPDDLRPGQPRAAVVSHEYWVEHLDAADDVVGRRIPVPTAEQELTVVGVLAPDFRLPIGGRAIGNFTALPHIWTVFRVEADDPERVAQLATAIGRLNRDAPLETARAEVGTISERLAGLYPESNAGRTMGIMPLRDAVVDVDSARLLWLFFGAVASVLLIAITNLGGLQIMRNAARRRELAIRTSVGAGRGQLIRQLLVETTLVSMAGGALGLLAGSWLLTIVVDRLPDQFPRAHEIGLDWSVAGVTIGVTLLAGLISSFFPALRTSRSVATTMGLGGRTSTRPVRATVGQRAFVGVEVALALVLVVGASLLTHSFVRLITEDAGMDERNLWSVEVYLPVESGPSGLTNALWESMLESIRGLEEVSEATIVSNALGVFNAADVRLRGLLQEGSTADPRTDGFTISQRSVGTNFFSSLGIPLIQGRPFQPADVAGSEPVTVINEMAARAMWPGEDPVGKRIVAGRSGWTVVGVVPDFKHNRLEREPVEQMYLPYTQGRTSYGSATLMVRAGSSSSALGPLLEDLVHSIEPNAEVTVSTMAQERWDLVAPERFRTAILLIFAGTATLLALAGVTGVVAYGVVQRSREIAIRVAVGARGSEVVGLMMRQALIPAIVGMAAGLLASLGLSRILESLLFEISPNDPATLAIAAGTMAAAALAASWFPARAATRIDAMTVLKQD